MATHIRKYFQQVHSDHFVLCAFGAATPDGYGICYNPQKEQIICTITSFKKCLTTDSQRFGTLLCKALPEMKTVLNAAQSLTTAKL